MKHGLYTFIQIYDVVAKKASKPSTDTEYKNISWVWEKDRNIRPEDRRLASRSLPSDDKVNADSGGRIFLSYPHTNNGFFYMLTTVFIYLFTYYFKQASRSPWIR